MTGYRAVVDPTLDGSYRPVLAQLPKSFGGGAVVAVVDAGLPRSADRIPADAAGAVVVGLLAEELSFRDLPILVDLPWSGSRVGRTPVELTTDLGLIDVEFAISEDDPRSLQDAATDLLVVVARNSPGEFRASLAVVERDTLVMHGEIDGIGWHVSGVRTAHTAFGGRIVFRGAVSAVEMRFPPPGAAWPAVMTSTEVEGETTRATEYSMSSRSTLLALIEAIESGSRPDDVATLARASRIFGVVHGGSAP